ncbi:MAG: hypothetical protein QSU88_10500 [Candidatus Methanoperedens sp.]|nr:hypothetical protein [Candidatus Methanoperedens sp.]
MKVKKRFQEELCSRLSSGKNKIGHYWNEPDYKKEASLESMMKYLINKGVHEPVAMHFRNPYVALYENESWIGDAYKWKKGEEKITNGFRGVLVSAWKFE